MKKKIGLLLMILLLAFALTACGGGDNNANDNTGAGTGTEGEVPLSTEVVGTPSDLGGEDGSEEMATPEP
jgi:ABC-type glycerol-3-phosphate transport system substrate-binding protein